MRTAAAPAPKVRALAVPTTVSDAAVQVTREIEARVGEVQFYADEMQERPNSRSDDDDKANEMKSRLAKWETLLVRSSQL
jgi:hypothetical protein